MLSVQVQVVFLVVHIEYGSPVGLVLVLALVVAASWSSWFVLPLWD